jgi:hypothetical protein
MRAGPRPAAPARVRALSRRSVMARTSPHDARMAIDQNHCGGVLAARRGYIVDQVQPWREVRDVMASPSWRLRGEVRSRPCRGRHAWSAFCGRSPDRVHRTPAIRGTTATTSAAPASATAASRRRGPGVLDRPRRTGGNRRQRMILRAGAGRAAHRRRLAAAPCRHTLPAWIPGGARSSFAAIRS